MFSHDNMTTQSINLSKPNSHLYHYLFIFKKKFFLLYKLKKRVDLAWTESSQSRLCCLQGLLLLLFNLFHHTFLILIPKTFR